MSRRGSNRDAHSISSLGLGPLSMNRNEPHPEVWTLVNVHRMEKREDYGNWFLDIQASILNCAEKLTGLLEECPHPNAAFTPDELSEARYSIAWDTARLQQRVYQTRLPPPPTKHRIVSMVSDNIHPGLRYY
ncbi:uncharacterized protein LOC120333192 [Styela clava]